MKYFILHFCFLLIGSGIAPLSESPPCPPQEGTTSSPDGNTFQSSSAMSPLEVGRGLVHPTTCSPEPATYTVYLFLGEECIISQNYTLLINRLHGEFASDKINFIGLFPNPSSNKEKMADFKQKYGLAFPLKHDALQKEMDRFGVRVTPEVVVFNHKSNSVVYRGRIDNTYFRVGKRRTVTTTSELEDVLKSIRNGQYFEPTKTDAVGCFITPLDARLKKIKMCSGQ